jgi:hypothetical protein
LNHLIELLGTAVALTSLSDLLDGLISRPVAVAAVDTAPPKRHEVCPSSRAWRGRSQREPQRFAENFAVAIPITRPCCRSVSLAVVD